MANKLIYHFSPYDNNPYGHGGCKRTNQIVTLVKKAGFNVQSLNYETTISKHPFSLVLNFLYGLVYSIIFKFPFIPSITGLIKVGYYVRLCKKDINRMEERSILLVEDFTKIGAIMIALAKRRNIQVIGAVHNIDSLVPDFKSSFSSKSAPTYFDQELFFFKKCDYVLTISREENWLLNLHNVRSLYLPYFPSDEVQKQLAEISVKRTSNNGRAFVLGTVLNPPTEKGIVDLIQVLEKSQVYTDVAGYGTDSLIVKCGDLKYVKIHGAISFEQMSEFMQNNQWFVVNQPYTSGVLTRIIESLIAGIVVIGNESALRSYHYLPGVYECDFSNFQLPETNNVIVDTKKYEDILKLEEKRFTDLLGNLRTETKF